MTLETCDRCKECDPARLEGIDCNDCGRRYVRCQEHGGLKGAKRSLHSHRALFGPHHRARHLGLPGTEDPR